MDWKQYIRTDSRVLHDAACFVGTRIPVNAVLDNPADGTTPDAILHEYLGLRVEHVSAALAYAAEPDSRPSNGGRVNFG